MYKTLGILFFIFTACQAVTLNSQVIPTFHKYKELNSQFIKSIEDKKKEKQLKNICIMSIQKH
jgi:hypothetical protein